MKTRAEFHVVELVIPEVTMATFRRQAAECGYGLQEWIEKGLIECADSDEPYSSADEIGRSARLVQRAQAYRRELAQVRRRREGRPGPAGLAARFGRLS